MKNKPSYLSVYGSRDNQTDEGPVILKFPSGERVDGEYTKEYIEAVDDYFAELGEKK